MTCIGGLSAILCGTFDEDKFVTIEHKGKRYYFELHSYLGPMPMNKKGEELKSQGRYFPSDVWTKATNEYRRVYKRGLPLPTKEEIKERIRLYGAY